MTEQERVADLCERLGGYETTVHPDVCIADRPTVDETLTELKRLAARCDALEEAQHIPEELLQLAQSIGRAEWGQTPAHDADGHAHHIATSVRLVLNARNSLELAAKQITQSNLEEPLP